MPRALLAYSITSRPIFDGQRVNRIRQLPRHPPGFAEKEVQHIDSVRSNVKERAAACLSRINQPCALWFSARTPILASDIASSGCPIAPAAAIPSLVPPWG